jgi:hypothetical protein
MDKSCFNCKLNEHKIPLIELNYQEKILFVCPRCLPQLIHKPSNLVGSLPGAENIIPAEDL